MSVSWTDPRTWVVGEKVRAAHLNAHLRDNLLFLYGGPRVALRRNDDLVVADDTFTVVPWQEPVRDVGGWFDSGSPEVVVVPRDGTYLVSFPHLWGASAEGERQCRLLRDIGSGWEEFRGDRVPAAFRTERSPLWMTDLAEGWSLGVDVRQTSGADLELEARTEPTRSPVFMAKWIGPFT